MTHEETQSKPNKPSHKKRMRNAKVRTMAVEGKSERAIARELGIDKETVGKILSDDETQAIVKLAESQLKGLVFDAVQTLKYAMDNKHEFGMIGAAVKTAVSVLKNIGALKENIGIEVSVIPEKRVELPDGTVHRFVVRKEN